MHKYLLCTLLIFSPLIVSGCSTIEKLSDYISENELTTSIVMRQAVGRYIAAGTTVEEEKSRALKVQARLETILYYIEGNPEISSKELLSFVHSSIDWSQLTVTDKMLLTDILTLFSDELDKYKVKVKVNSDVNVVIKALVRTAISTAKIYLLEY